MKLIIHRKKDGGKPHLTLVAKNGQVWFTSEVYDSNSNADRAADGFVKALYSEGLETETVEE